MASAIMTLHRETTMGRRHMLTATMSGKEGSERRLARLSLIRAMKRIRAAAIKIKRERTTGGQMNPSKWNHASLVETDRGR